MAARHNDEAAMRQLWDSFKEDLVRVDCNLCGLPLQQTRAGAPIALDCANGCAAFRVNAHPECFRHDGTLQTDG
jgi:hypothetical protein